MFLKALAFIDAEKKNLLALLKQTANINSPTFSEKEKIIFLQQQLKKSGIKSVIDNYGTLAGRLNGSLKSGRKVLVIAHTDTVLKPVGKVKETEKYFFGHGVCDNSTGVVALLTILRLIKQFKFNFSGQLIFAFTVQEEGLGAKKGMQFVMSKIGHVDAVVNLESHDVGRIINESPGQYRAELVVEVSKAGHSFRDFGNPNAIILLAQFMAEFAKLPGFKKRETTFNIGKIEGGEGINAIAKQAQILLEIRSLKQEKLVFLKQQLKKLEQRFFNPKKGIKLTKKVFADTLAASLPKSNKIYKLTQEVHDYLKIKSWLEMGNNDGEVALAKGIPMVTLGSSWGYKTHSLEEYVDKQSFILGLKQDFLVVLNILINF